jgi:hypothetical protein
MRAGTPWFEEGGAGVTGRRLAEENAREEREGEKSEGREHGVEGVRVRWVVRKRGLGLGLHRAWEVV